MNAIGSATADLRYVFVDLESWAKTPIPAAVREGLGPLLL